MKVVGYIRVSTDNQEMSGLSLEAQEDKIKSYCKLYNLELVGIFQDASTGRKLNRPGLQEALDLLNKNEAAGLIVAKLDRLTRSVKDMGILLDKYFRDKFNFFVVTEQIDTRNASGRLMLNLLVSVAEWEAETIVERTKTALAIKKKRGEKTGGTVPYGYDVGSDGKLKLNPREQEVISRIVTLKENGSTYKSIAEYLNESNILTKCDKKWCITGIARIVKNQSMISA